MVKTNYYKTLGVTHICSDQQLKTAFRKLAMQYHPDRNLGSKEAEQKFKEICEAYEILKDPRKRAIYDQLYHVVSEKEDEFSKNDDCKKLDTFEVIIESCSSFYKSGYATTILLIASIFLYLSSKPAIFFFIMLMHFIFALGITYIRSVGSLMNTISTFVTAAFFLYFEFFGIAIIITLFSSEQFREIQEIRNKK